MPDRDRIGQGRFDRELVTVPVTSAPRVVRWWPLIFVALGLALLAPRVLGLKEEPVWLSTASDIFGIITTLVGFILLGLAGREYREARPITLDQVQLRRADFPFHIVRSTTELTNILLPDPTGEVPLPDRDVPYIPRDLTDLDRAFLEKGRVLLRGRSKTGKTRAVIELLREYWRTSPAVLVLKRTAELRAPTFVPDDLPRRNLVVLVDDLHVHALACRRRRTHVGAALSDVVDFFVQHCGNQLSEVRLIAIVRREPECWEQIDYDPAKTPWSEVELVDLADLSVDEARRLVVELGDMSPPLGLASEIADAIVRTNDGTFYRLILAFRDWRNQPSKREITAQDVASLQTDLAGAWRHRQSVLFQHKPQLRYVYGALDLAQAIEVPSRQDLIAILAQSLRGNLITRIYAWAVAAQKWVQIRLTSLRWLRRVNARMTRMRVKAVVWLLWLQSMLLWPLRRLLKNRRESTFWFRIWPWLSRIVFILLVLAICGLGVLAVLGVAVIGLVVGLPRIGETGQMLVSWLSALVATLCFSICGVQVLLLSSRWILEPLVLLDRMSLHRAVEKYAGATEIPVVETILVPYDSQVEGAVQEFSTQAWVSDLMQARDLTMRNHFLSSALQRWFDKADFSAIGWEASVRVGEVLVRLEPKNPSVHNRLGWSCYWQDRDDEAIAAFQRAIELDPNTAGYYNNLGTVYRDLGRQEEAIAAFQRAIELDPTAAYPHNGLGFVYTIRGQYEEAIASFERAVELDPHGAWPHNNLGVLYRHLDRYDESIAVLQRAVDLDPSSGLHYANFAATCREIGQEENYKKYIRHARKLMEDESEYGKACIESIAGNVDAAMEHLAKALEKAPGNRELARRDPDFAFIRDAPRFRELVGSTSDRGNIR